MEIDQILKDLDEFLQSSIDRTGYAVDYVNKHSLSDEQQAILEKNFNGWSAPIKGRFFNSGNYGKGDARHKGRHDGVDLRAPGGTSVYPIGVGFVEQVDKWEKGGNIITILHPRGVRTYNAHLGTVKVQPGDYVDKNTVIGTLGNSGNASTTVPHIHLEIRVNGVLTDPGNFFDVPPYTNFDRSKEKAWLSYEAKQEAKDFNMKEHKMAFIRLSYKLLQKYGKKEKNI